MNDEINAENGSGTANEMETNTEIGGENEIDTDNEIDTGNNTETRYDLTEEDDAVYPEGYDPESGEDFFPPEAPPLPETETPAPETVSENAAETIQSVTEAGQSDVKSTPETQAPLPDFRADLEALDRVYPDAAKEGIPEEVIREYRSGTPLLTAYAAHRSKSDAQTIAALRAENAALKQNAANRERAVVRGVSGGAPVNEPDDPFLRGLREDW